jgi:hypothetical protein
MHSLVAVIRLIGNSNSWPSTVSLISAVGFTRNDFWRSRLILNAMAICIFRADAANFCTMPSATDRTHKELNCLENLKSSWLLAVIVWERHWQKLDRAGCPSGNILLAFGRIWLLILACTSAVLTVRVSCVPQPVQANARIVSRLDHHSFLSDPYKFIFHYTIRRYIV